MTQVNHVTMRIEKNDSGIRLDVFLSQKFPQYSRASFNRLINTGHVLINGKTAKASYKLKNRDLVTINSLPPHDCQNLSPPKPEPIPLDIIYADEHIIVINKPPGLVVHPAPGHPADTLVNGLIYQFPDIKDAGPIHRPGIVHRLDKDTSGIMIAARTNHAWLAMTNQFRNRTVKKVYAAILCGHLYPETGEIDIPITRNLSERKKMAVSHSPEKGRNAKSSWTVIDYFPGFSLVEFRLHTGRTHQIRVHARTLGHPVAGDRVYGYRRRYKKELKGDLKRISNEITRQMLHSKEIEFLHPATGQSVFFSSPLPQDMQYIISKLEKMDDKS